MYTPFLTFVKRKEKACKGSVGIWITMPDGENWSIWDLSEKELTTNVMHAIAHAFERGMLAHKLLVIKSSAAITPMMDPKIQK